jgi:hypothetical protein
MNESQRRMAERASWGEPVGRADHAPSAPPRPGLQLLGFKAVRRNTLRGFAEVRLPNQLIVSDIVVGEAGGRQWALLPSKPMVDRDGSLRRDEAGKIRYSPVVEWASPALRDEFSKRVVALVRAQYPDAFDAGDALPSQQGS